MPPPADPAARIQPAARTENALRRFRRNRRGSAAVEFALVAPVFLALLFAIIETALVFFASQVLETGVQDAGRQMYTHQLQDSGVSVAAQKVQFETDLCNRIKALFTCSGIGTDVRTFAAGTAVTLSDPITSGAYDPSSFTFALPPSGSAATVVVRGFYQWPLIVTGLGYNITNITVGGNKRLLAATAAFRVEP